MKKYLFLGILAIALVVVGVSITKAQSTGPYDLHGWAWSSNTGWINFNCNDAVSLGFSTACSDSTGPNAPSGYKVQVQVNGSSGDLTGWGWSSNEGWIKFGGLSGFPTIDPSAVASNAQVDISTGKVTGWVRACAGTSNKDCASGDRTDGWDGWINLSGSNHSSPGSVTSGGVTLDIDTNSSTFGQFHGFAWDEAVGGWINFYPGLGLAQTTCTNDCGVGPSQNIGGTCNPSGSVDLTSSGDVSFTATGSGGTSYDYSWDGGYSYAAADMNHTGSVTKPFPYGEGTTAGPNLVIRDHNNQTHTATAVPNCATVNVGSVAPSTCSAPSPSASFCGGSDNNGPQSSAVLHEFGSCPTPDENGNVVSCQFQCDSGYKKLGNSCVKSSEGEI